MKIRGIREGMRLNERIIPVVIFFIAFLVSVYSAASIPSAMWRSDGWIMGFVGFGILTSLSALLLAYWFYIDYNANQETIELLEKRLHEIGAYMETKKREERGHTFFDEKSRELFKKEKES
jgi:protein-S-isoprenylcysteine O-methyltransferase Ste14